MLCLVTAIGSAIALSAALVGVGLRKVMRQDAILPSAGLSLFFAGLLIKLSYSYEIFDCGDGLRPAAIGLIILGTVLMVVGLLRRSDPAPQAQRALISTLALILYFGAQVIGRGLLGEAWWFWSFIGGIVMAVAATGLAAYAKRKAAGGPR